MIHQVVTPDRNTLPGLPHRNDVIWYQWTKHIAPLGVSLITSWAIFNRAVPAFLGFVWTLRKRFHGILASPRSSDIAQCRLIAGLIPGPTSQALVRHWASGWRPSWFSVGWSSRSGTRVMDHQYWQKKQHILSPNIKPICQIIQLRARAAATWSAICSWVDDTIPYSTTIPHNWSRSAVYFNIIFHKPMNNYF